MDTRKVAVLLLIIFLAPFPLWAQIKVLPLGDSITQGDAANGTYRQPLWQLLQGAGIAVDFVGSFTDFNNCGSYTGAPFDQDHEGHWGWTTDEIVATGGAYWNCRAAAPNKVLSDWLQGYTPDVALIHLGTNDILKETGSVNTVVANTITDLGAAIAELRSDNPNIVVFLAQVIPSRWGSDNIKLDQLNAEIPILASSLNTSTSPVIVVDQNSGYDPLVDSWDAYHPNSSGQQKMAQKWFDAISAYFTTFPVQWGEMSVEVQHGRVYLNWQTLSEVNTLGFEIERSLNAVENFQSVHFEPAAGQSEGPRNYQFRSSTMPQGTYLFRIKQVDYDGGFSYSRLMQVTVDHSGDRGRGLIVQNAADKQSITCRFFGFDPNESVRLIMVDVTGNTVAEEHVILNDSIFRWEQLGIPAGMYIIKVSSSHQVDVIHKFFLK